MHGNGCALYLCGEGGGGGEGEAVQRSTHVEAFRVSRKNFFFVTHSQNGGVISRLRTPHRSNFLSFFSFKRQYLHPRGVCTQQLSLGLRVILIDSSSSFVSGVSITPTENAMSASAFFPRGCVSTLRPRGVCTINNFTFFFAHS